MTFEEIKIRSGMTAAELSRYFEIPYRTVNQWDNEARKCPEYLLKLMYYKLEKEGALE